MFLCGLTTYRGLTFLTRGGKYAKVLRRAVCRKANVDIEQLALGKENVISNSISATTRFFGTVSVRFVKR